MKKSISLMLLIIGVGLSSGCAGMPKSWSQKMPWGEKPSQISESKYQAPVKIVALWSPAMYNAAGKKPTRGFGGRLYFYNAKNEAIPVQGQLVVYCYDDSNKSQDHKQADRRLAFTPEQFSSHFSPTELGASYSVWVPWDAIGNPQANISLVPIFTAATGQIVVGEQSVALLPGPETPLQEKNVEEKVFNAAIKREGEVTRVGYDEELPGGPPSGQSRINTLSITMPENLAKRVASSRNQEEPRLLPAGPDVQSGVQPRPLVPQVPASGSLKNGFGGEATRGSLPEQRRGLFPPLAPLAHSEHSLPQVPTSQPPRPVGGPAPMQPPQSEQP